MKREQTPRDTCDQKQKTGKQREQLRENRVSLVRDRSQGGNDPLRLVHIPRGELEPRGDGRLLGELEFLEGLISVLHLNESQPKIKEYRRSATQPHKDRHNHALTILWVPAISRGVPWARSPSVNE